MTQLDNTLSTKLKPKKPELLAPAGGFEQLRYALYFGADAVYLACDKFGLRQRAANFSLEDIPRAVEMAHEARAKVYVTLNAYLHDSDLDDLPAYLKALEAAGVDAFIVSDLGVLALAREHAPSVDIHVSTQASVSNVEAARMWQQLGATRVVPAREMSIEEISQLKRELPDLEVEVFVQGAMCMAISGRCLISDFLTGRSANQGHCVQPCRWSYRLEEESRPGQYFPVEEDERGAYLMNSKDLNMLVHLDDLIAAGVDSIKIEGRVKKAFYVATVVNAYRHVLDGEDPLKWENELDRISHRPYSTGFFFGNAEQSVDDDIYVQHYDWVGEVVDSHLVNAVGVPKSADLCKTFESGGASKTGSVNEASDVPRWRTIVFCRNRFYEGDILELLSPHQDVRPIEIARLEELIVVDEDRFASDRVDLENDQESSSDLFGYSFVVDDAKNGNGLRTLRVADALPTTTANKAMGFYVFDAPIELHPSDILRAKRRDPSRKN